MGRLLDFLVAARGERSTEGRIGLWRKKVSEALDGSAAPDFGFAKKGPSLAVVGLNDNLPIDLVGLVRGISYVPASASWILRPGRTYLLQADGWFSTFSDAEGQIDVAWVDENNVRLLGGGVDSPDSPTARFRPATCTALDTSGAGTLSMVYPVPVGSSVLIVAKLRILGATGTAQMPSGSWTSTVLEIPG